MRFENLQGIARNTALIFALALTGVLSINAQNSNAGNARAANANTGGTTVQTTNTNTATGANTSATPANTPRVESTATPRPQATATTRTEVQTVVKEERGFPWGLLGLLGLLGLIPKKRAVEVTGVRETTREETVRTTDNRNDRT